MVRPRTITNVYSKLNEKPDHLSLFYSIKLNPTLDSIVLFFLRKSNEFKNNSLLNKRTNEASYHQQCET